MADSPVRTFLQLAGNEQGALFVVDKVTKDAMALEDKFRALDTWWRKEILAVNNPKSAELERGGGRCVVDGPGRCHRRARYKSDEIVPAFDGAVAAADECLAGRYGRGGRGEEGASTEARSAKQDGAVAAAEPNVPSATEIDAVLASGIAALEAQAKGLTDTVRQGMDDLTLRLNAPHGLFRRWCEPLFDGNNCALRWSVRCRGCGSWCKILSVVAAM